MLCVCWQGACLQCSYISYILSPGIVCLLRAVAVYAAALPTCCVAAVQGVVAALGKVNNRLNVEGELLVSSLFDSSRAHSMYRLSPCQL